MNTVVQIGVVLRTEMFDSPFPVAQVRKMEREQRQEIELVYSDKYAHTKGTSFG